MNVIKSAFMCVALMSSTVAMAGPIVWSSAQNTANALDVLASGNLVEAFNAGPSNTGTITVNGVTFVNTDNLLSESASANPLNGSSSGDASYNQLLNTFDYGGGVSTSLSIGGGNLLAGSNYMLQLWFTDLRSCCSGRNMTFGDGLGGNVNLNATGNGLGQFAVGQFTASSASQTLALITNGFGNAHLTAYQIRAVDDINSVPVPAPLFLLGMGLALIGFGRKTVRINSV